MNLCLLRLQSFSIRRKLRELSQEGKKKLKSQKTYVNESLSPAYKCILGKCNALLKRNMLMHFTHSMEKLKLNMDAEAGKKPLK